MISFSIEELKQHQLLCELKSKGLEFAFVDDHWVNFIKNEVNGEFIGLRITSANGDQHFFVGIAFKKYGIRIVGAPFPGWGTSYMGIISNGVISAELISSLLDYLFNKFPISYIQITSRQEISGTADLKRCEISRINSLIIDLSKGIDRLYHDLKGDCRTFLRQFDSKAGSITEEHPDSKFIDLFYEQLVQVFKRQGMVPTHSYVRIKNMFNYISKGEIDVLCLKAKDDNDKPIATSVFFGLNGTCYYWAGASSTDGQHFRPNESMIWYAIKHFDKKGYKSFDMMGERDYKLKFSPEKVFYSKVISAKPFFLYDLYRLSYFFYLLINKARGFDFVKNIGNKISPNFKLVEVLPYEFMHYKSDNLNIYSKANVIYVEGTSEKKLTLPMSFLKSLLIKSRLLRRIFRLDKCCVIPTVNGYIIFWQGSVYHWSHNGDLQKTLTMVNCRNPMHNTIAQVDTSTFIFGEYGRPHTSGKKIYKTSDAGLTWKEIYQFQPTKIRHVHCCIWDEYEERLWTFTGDANGECYVINSDADFKDLKFYGDGSQTFRATGAFIDKNYIHWIMDSPLDEVRSVKFNKTTGDIVLGQSFPGPVYYYHKTEDGVHLVCTAQEPGDSLTDNSVHVFASRKMKKWVKCGSFKHDGLPKRIFRFGVGVFPAGTYTSKDVVISFDSVKKLDGKAVRFYIKGI